MTTRLSFQITDIETEFTIPVSEKVLNVTVVGDDLFLSIMDYTETNKERKLVEIANIAVKTEPLLAGINAAAIADRLDKKEYNERF